MNTHHSWIGDAVRRYPFTFVYLVVMVTLSFLLSVADLYR